MIRSDHGGRIAFPNSRLKKDDIVLRDKDGTPMWWEYDPKNPHPEGELIRYLENAEYCVHFVMVKHASWGLLAAMLILWVLGWLGCGNKN